MQIDKGLFLKISSFVVVFICCSMYCIFICGINNVFADLDSVLLFLGGSDGGTYIRCAQDVINGKNKFLDSWMLGLWPPGMLSLACCYLYAFSNSISIGMYYALIISLIYSLLFIKLYECFKEYRISNLCRYLSIFLSTTLLVMQLDHLTIFYSDIFSNGTFCCGIAFMFLSFRDGKKVNYILSGTFFTFSCFFRSHCFLILVAILILLLIHLIANWKNPSVKSVVFNSVKYTFTIIMICISAYHAVSKGKYCYNKADYLWTLPFIGNEGFIYHGGMSTAGDCDINRKKIISEGINSKEYNKYKNSRVLRKIVILSPVQYPLYYIKHKVPIGWRYFHSGENFIINWLTILFFSFSLCSFLFGVGIYSVVDAFSSIIVISSFLSSFVPSLILHFEARYFLPFKLVSLLCFILYLGRNYENFRQDIPKN